MRKFLLIPDSFKGTMSSAQICGIMAEQIRRHYPGADIRSIPVADGGEGSVDCFLAAMGGEKIPLSVRGPYGGAVDAFYGVTDGGATAIVEMAAAAGLPLVGADKRPQDATTYGVGQLMADAARRGCKKLIVGLGGSATNDLGMGAAAGAGARFLDRDGRAFVPTGGTLDRVADIDLSGLEPALGDMEIITMCDIDNPLYGPAGAAYVFGPQKGAAPALADLLDQQLRAGADVIRRVLGKDVALLAGAGAAGGMGAGMAAFFGARLQMGIDAVLDTVGFEEAARGAHCIFTGEGKIDSQSLRGKVVMGVARRAKPLGVPVVAVVGDIGDDIEAAYDQGVSAIFSINRVAVDFAKARGRSPADLALTMDNLLRWMQVLEQ